MKITPEPTASQTTAHTEAAEDEDRPVAVVDVLMVGDLSDYSEDEQHRFMELFVEELCDRGVDALEADTHNGGYSENVPDATWFEALEAAGERLSAEQLTAEVRHDIWTVSDSSGNRWWPHDDAATEIAGAPDPAARAIEVCKTQPRRGDWIS